MKIDTNKHLKIHKVHLSVKSTNSPRRNEFLKQILDNPRTFLYYGKLGHKEKKKSMDIKRCEKIF